MIYVLIYGFFILFASTAITYTMYARYDKEFRENNSQRSLYAPIINPIMLPTYLIIAGIISIVYPHGRYTVSSILGMCFGVFLHISVYYALLMILLPLFRKFISARACAVLWILPNMLYVTASFGSACMKPVFVIKTEGSFAKIAAFVWFIGFAAIMLWNMINHLKFRRSILKHAEKEETPEILSLWESIQQEFAVKKANYRIVRSEYVSTPLSIGLFKKSICVVLPDREYTDSELDLIFRHELIHILHGDCWMKVFLSLCTAICWFNPFIWLTKRKCAEDTERSCDELVLLEANAEERKQYAELILSATGDERGFTTCLSATAKSLKYRIKSIVKPRKTLIGGFTAGIILAVLLMTSGMTALAYGKTTVSDILFNGEPENYAVSNMGFDIASYDGFHFCQCNDEKALIEYLAGLEVYTLSGEYGFDEDGKEIVITFDKPNGGLVGLDVTEHYLSVTYFGEKITQAGFYIFDEIDWELIYSLTDFYHE